MSSLRFKKRCLSAEFLSIGYISSYKFLFDKRSKDGSGKGNVHQSYLSTDIVWGVIFEIQEKDKLPLDRAEGKGNGYSEQLVEVTANEQKIEAIMYRAIDLEYVDESLLPFDWYKDHCVRGAIEFKLPDYYIDFLKAFPVVVDTDLDRREKESPTSVAI
jgi:gamma-glutamylcyclotransferase